jgi:hypothetical protein
MTDRTWIDHLEAILDAAAKAQETDNDAVMERGT